MFGKLNHVIRNRKAMAGAGVRRSLAGICPALPKPDAPMPRTRPLSLLTRPRSSPYTDCQGSVLTYCHKLHSTLRPAISSPLLLAVFSPSGHYREAGSIDVIFSCGTLSNSHNSQHRYTSAQLAKHSVLRQVHGRASSPQQRP